MKNIEYWLKRNHRRITFGRFLSRASDSLGAFLFLFGAMVLGVRLALPQWWPSIGWFALLEIPMLAAAFWYAMIVRPKPYEADAVLDERLGTGGLLMTLRETGDSEWARSIDKTSKQWNDSLVRLPWGRCARSVVVPVLFALAACTIPGRTSVATPVLRNSVGRQATGDLQKLLDKLASSNLVDSQRTDQLRETVRRLVAESETQPLTHQKWGVIDSVRDVMRMELDSSSMSAGNALSLLQSLQKQFAESGFDPANMKAGEIPLEQLAQGFDPDQAKRLVGTLSGLAKALSQNSSNENFPPEVAELLRKVMSNGELKLPEDLPSQLAMLNELSGLIRDESDLLSDVRSQLLSGDNSWTQLGGSLLSGMMGGRRDDPVGIANPLNSAFQSIFGSESDQQQKLFDQVTVAAPPREREDKINSGIPTVGPEAQSVRNEPREFGDSEGNERWSRRFRPRHRKVVERYFANRD